MAFWTAPTDEPKPKQKATRAASEEPRKVPAKRAVITRDLGERGCSECPLKARWPIISSPKMKMSGNVGKETEILVLGEAPGADEDQAGEIFIGKTGQLLRKFLPMKDMRRIAFQNAVRCRPDGNATPDAKMQYCCSQHLEDDVASLPKLKAILGAGAVPLARMINVPGTSILAIQGVKFPIKIANKVLWYFPISHPSFVMRLRGDKGGDGPAQPVFEADIKEFFHNVDRWKQPCIVDSLIPNNVYLPKSFEEAVAIRARMKKPLAVDLECDSPIKGVPKPYQKGARLLTGSISDGSTTLAISVEHPEGPTDWGLEFLLDTIERFRWIAHNATFELVWLKWMHHKLKRKKSIMLFEDTMALARLVHQREGLNGLDIATRIHLGVNVKAITKVKASKIGQYPLSETLKYCGLDTQATALLFHELINQVDEEHYEKLLERIDSLAEMEMLGLPISINEAENQKGQWQKIVNAAEERALRTYEAREFQAAYGKPFRVSNAIDVGDALANFGKVKLPKTPAGKQFKTDDEVLNELCPTNPLSRAVLDYREARKIISTYIDVVLETPDIYIPGNFMSFDSIYPIIHPSYNAVNVRTGRLSSSDPNIQNWPKRRHREVRKQVIAPKGYVIVPMDEGQLEARIIAMASRDINFVKAIIDGFDVHSHWLDKLIQKEPEYLDRLARKTNQNDPVKIRKAGRDIIKTDFVFSSFFGAGAKHVADITGLPLNLITELHTEFWGRNYYHGVKKWIELRRLEYKNTGSIRTLTGRVRHNILMRNEPLNTPIQGTGADLVLDAQAALMHLARREGDFHFMPRINVHDDLTFLLPDNNDLELYIKRIAQEMIAVRYKFQIVPLAVEVKLGYNWADLEEVHTFIGDYVR